MATSRSNQFPSEVINCQHIARNECCSICWEAYIDGVTEVKVLPCGHFFHGQCLELWLNQSSTCPFCRYNLPSVGVFAPPMNNRIMIVQRVANRSRRRRSRSRSRNRRPVSRQRSSSRARLP